MRHPRFVVFGCAGSYWWELVSSSGMPMARSVRSYRSPGAAKRAIGRMLHAAHEAAGAMKATGPQDWRKEAR